MGQTHLYGIIEGRDEAVLGVHGVDGASPVRTVVRDGLACVVSEYSGEDLGTLTKEKLLRRLLVHQQVVEHVMGDHTVLPVKFGTVLDSAREVLGLLSQGHPGFVDALAFIQDKVEIEVAATWDTGRVLEEISKEEEVVRARDAIAGKGRPTVEDQMRMGQLVKVCMDRRRNIYLVRMVGFLEPLAVDVASNALVSDEMVMNVAFLVDRTRQREFDERVLELDELFRNEIAFRVIGPLPPYSFSTVEVTRLTRERIEEARQTLQLSEVTSEAAVRRAYRRLAAEGQRGLGVDDGRADTQPAARLRHASELLLTCCQAREQAQAGGRRRGRAEPDTDCLFAIAVRRSGSDEVESARFGAAAPVAAGGL